MKIWFDRQQRETEKVDMQNGKMQMSLHAQMWHCEKDPCHISRPRSACVFILDGTGPLLLP